MSSGAYFTKHAGFAELLRSNMQVGGRDSGDSAFEPLVCLPYLSTFNIFGWLY